MSEQVIQPANNTGLSGQATSAGIVVPTAANTDLETLTRVKQVRELSPRAASQGYPVRITGLITYSDPLSYMHFFQDDSAGIYLAVDYLKTDWRVAAGQRVEITGFTGPGDYAPIIYAEQVEELGTGAYPPAKPVTPEMLLTGSEDSQWVAFKGVVHDWTVNTNETVLTLWNGGLALQVTIPGAAPAPAGEELIDAAVEVHGVCGTIFNDRRRLEGVRLYVPDWSRVAVTEPAPEDPLDLPLRPISELFQFHSDSSTLHRVHVQGGVILSLADGSFFLQDSTGGVQVRCRAHAPVVPIGAVVEVVGFPVLGDKLPVLQDAMVKVLDRGVMVVAARIELDAAFNEEWHASLVRLKGQVLSHGVHPKAEIVALQFGPHVIDAVLERRGDPLLANISPGSMVGITGVYVARLDDQRKVQSFQVLLRTGNDVAVISRPSWWTTGHLSWALGGVIAILVLALVWAVLLRRQVQKRTRELREEIEERKRTAEALKQTQSDLVESSRLAGMAEVATSVLHNVGNVLNSINVSTTLVAERLRRSKVTNLARAAVLLREHEEDLGRFITTDARGRQLPDYLGQLAEHLAREQNTMLAEVEALRKNVEHIKDIVTTQQNYARVAGVSETVQITDLVEDALRVNAGALVRHDVQVVRDYAPAIPPLRLDKHKVLQILVNLVHNAKYACDESGRSDKRLTVRVANGQGRVRISVDDNGVGIPGENLTRIFSLGFTTRKHGHGFGLHSGALAARELGGTLRAESAGPGQGAVFTLELPLTEAVKATESDLPAAASPAQPQASA